ncbi:MAG: DUF1553 domain-containing protein [Planctomycetota bacterium]
MARWIRHLRTAPAVIALAAWSAGALLAPTPRAPAERIVYGRDIRPLLSDRCFHCHGPDDAAREADLSLDSFERATADRGGYAAIVPGKPDESELWKRIDASDPDDAMPPASSRKPRLTARERETIRSWIEAGAPYEEHWSFVPPVRPLLPDVQRVDWAANPIDRFVLAELERHGVAPSPPADRATWLRRVFLDLSGLPPTPDEIDAFLADGAPDAHARWVDKLFHDEPYKSRCAERMATPWLDAARYADTSGIHTDAGRSISAWRDWVLAAYRDNMPFDRFLTEQLAGDLLPGATVAQRTASGFNRNHVTTDEGGAIPEEALVEYAVDRAATTSSVFLGLTMGCARCHDHKFDPISQAEFYGFLAYFNSIDEPGLYSQLPDAKRAFEPALEVPTPAQSREIGELDAEIAAERIKLDEPVPGEDAARALSFHGMRDDAALAWKRPLVVSAKSSGGAQLTLQDDGSVLASGANPDQDEHVLTLRTDGRGVRLVCIEALPDATLANGRIGRAPNGNAVLTGVTTRVRSIEGSTQEHDVRFVWAWADHEQADGDYAAVNVLDASDERGWAVDAHRVDGARVLLLLADAPFGFAGGSEIEVRLQYRSSYAAHTLGRVRLSVSPLVDEFLARLPLALGRWVLVGPFPAASGAEAYERAYGPERDTVLERAHNFGFGNQVWQHDPALADARLNDGLPKGTNATYVAREIFAPSAREVRAAIGSDDGFRLFVGGKEVASRAIDRGLAADQDRASFALTAGTHALLLKIANTGGDAGFFWRFETPSEQAADVLDGDLALVLAPEHALSPALERRAHSAWRTAFSAEYRERSRRLTALERRRDEVRAGVAQTMVMRELATPRATHVLMRGVYDQPDAARPVERGVPRALGRLPEGATRDRLGLARWMTAPENPLVARVAANRAWELLFGTGLVRTSEDLGLQGEWPSHPELLDWLAVELSESGWDVQALVARIVTSNTYRQSSRARAELASRDPDNRWLSHYPRRRLGAEEIRDTALYVSGLLVERFGGPSVKPYQPPGLWEEVAMPASNTRTFEPGVGADLWRRSVYTYWKRAAPPPSLAALDAPTRESCTIRRSITNTPLQALVVWNDPQFVEAARAFAQRSELAAQRSDAASSRSDLPSVRLAPPQRDRARLAWMFRCATGRAPDDGELDALALALAEFRERYRRAPEDALALVSVGASPRDERIDVAELAAWTMIANVLLSLDATISRG